MVRGDNWAKLLANNRSNRDADHDGNGDRKNDDDDDDVKS